MNLLLCDLSCVFLLCSGVGCSGSSGGRKSFPEAAHMSVTSSFVHMCSGQHSPCLPGGDQTQAGRRAEKGESLSHSRIKEGAKKLIYIKVFCCCVLVALGGGCGR